MTDWMQQTFQIEMDPAKLDGQDAVEAVRQILWNAFDDRYRPEMHRMERNLLLDLLDSTWKNHLLTMDHLRNVVGLRGMPRKIPKTVYKKEGMAEFGRMWENLNDRVTDMVFRVEDAPEDVMQEALWAGAVATQAQAMTMTQQARNVPANDGLANATTNAATREEGRTDPQHGPKSRPQRSVPVRQRQEVQELPHEDGAAAVTDPKLWRDTMKRTRQGVRNMVVRIQDPNAIAAMRAAKSPIEVQTPDGVYLGRFVPSEPNKMTYPEIGLTDAELEGRANDPGVRWYTADEVMTRLRQLRQDS